jgi:hypothetical protein
MNSVLDAMLTLPTHAQGTQEVAIGGATAKRHTAFQADPHWMEATGWPIS